MPISIAPPLAATLPISQADVTGLTAALAAKAPVAGTPVVRGPFSFTFATAGLNNGVAFYTPTVNDVLLEAWIEVDTAFDGTTPRADLSQYTGADTPYGFFGWSSVLGPGIDLAVVDTTANGGGPLQGAFPTGGGVTIHNIALSQSYGEHQRRTPARFTTADPLLLVVSQDGTKGGAAVGGAAGAARVYVITATPVAF